MIRGVRGNFRDVQFFTRHHGLEPYLDSGTPGKRPKVDPGGGGGDGPIAPIKPVKHWVDFKLIDDKDNSPMAGVIVSLKYSKGGAPVVEDKTTNAQGIIQIEGVDDKLIDILAVKEPQGMYETVSIKSFGTRAPGSPIA